MRVKTFRGDAASQVLKRIKAELGADAVILSTRTFKENGVSVCEITAALEDDAAPAAFAARRAATRETPPRAQPRDRDEPLLLDDPLPADALASPPPGRRAGQAAYRRAAAPGQILAGQPAPSRQDLAEHCGTVAGPALTVPPAASSFPGPVPSAVSRLPGSPGLPGEEVLASLAGVGTWQQEWSRIREHLLAALKPQLSLRNLAPRQRLALEYLEREGVEDAALLDLVSVLENRPDISILNPLARMAPVAPLDFAAPPSRILGVMGPAGVGKTSAAIRLALAAKASPDFPRHGRVCLVNADTQRSKGRLLLRQYADLADFDYREIAPGEDGEDVLAELTGHDLVVLDLPALARGETMDQLLSRLGLSDLAEEGGLALLLTLAPHYAQSQLRHFSRQYLTRGVLGLLWTKLDEAQEFGNVINTAHALGLPAVALSAGPGLRDDLVPATHKTLWGLLFKHRLPQTGAA